MSSLGVMVGGGVGFVHSFNLGRCTLSRIDAWVCLGFAECMMWCDILRSCNHDFYL
jgi:hypothetical protein